MGERLRSWRGGLRVWRRSSMARDQALQRRLSGPGRSVRPLPRKEHPGFKASGRSSLAQTSGESPDALSASPEVDSSFMVARSPKAMRTITRL